MNKKTKHHIITENYQAQFADQTGKIWVLNSKGKRYRTNPTNSLKEDHFFTVAFPNVQGGSLFVEDSLALIEGHFKSVVEEKIKKELPVTNEERQVVSMFIAAMMVRTKIFRKQLEVFYNNILQMGKRIQKEKRQFPDESHSSFESQNDGVSLDELEGDMLYLNSAHSVSVVDSVIENSPIIAAMNWSYMLAPAGQIFVTSDNPVSMCSPQRENLYGQNAIGARTGILSEDVELVFPLTQKISLLAGYMLKSDQVYQEITEKEVKHINYRTVRRAEHIIAPSEEVLKEMK